jgi:hypothetical protein
VAKLNLIVLALAACVAAGGCATPSQHWIAAASGPGESVPRVRALARIVLLPPVYEIDGGIDGAWSPETENARLRDETVHYLAEWKGYRAEAAGTTTTATGLTADALRSALLAHHRNWPAPGAPLPDALAASVREFASVHRADGVAVLGVRFFGLDAARWGVIYGTTFFTLGIGQWFYIASLGTYTDAAIYDGATGALAWWASGQAEEFGGRPLAAKDIGRFAFDALPTALPEPLLRQRAQDRP